MTASGHRGRAECQPRLSLAATYFAAAHVTADWLFGYLSRYLKVRHKLRQRPGL